VRSLLEFSRDREFRKEPLPLRPLVEETVRFLKGQIPAGVLVEVAVPAEITLLGDRQRLQQVFLNLVKNAVEAVPPGSGRVVVGARRVTAGSALQSDAALVVHGAGLPVGDVIEIEVRDNGPGIPAEIRKKIFDPFFTTKDVGKGSGLGLFIAYEIIDEHDGSIAVESATGGGTAFTIRLPA
jgi:two-component system NtrC family sensor kinase